MKTSKLIAMALTAACMGMASPAQAEPSAPAVPAQKPFESRSGLFDIEALMALGRVSSPQVSPDGKKIMFAVNRPNLKKNKSNTDIYVCNIDGTGLKRITESPASENDAVWIDGGKRIAFIYAPTGNPQIWVMNADGTGRKCITAVDNGVNGFLLSPDQSKILIIADVKYARTAKDVYPDLPKATGRIIDDLMYKHWDEWVTQIPHPFIADFNQDNIIGLKDIMVGEPFESPMKPFGGVESFSWSPDGKTLLYVSRKKQGKDYALSTDSGIYEYDVEKDKTRLLTPGMHGYDTCPAYSPDGTRIAWLSMARDGYEADKNRLMVMDVATGNITDLTADWDYTIEEFAWQPDGKSLLFIAYQDGGAPVFKIDAATREVKILSKGLFDYTGLCPLGNGDVITMRHSMLRPNEIYRLTTTGKGKKSNTAVKRLTGINDDIFAQLTLPEVTYQMVPTTDGKLMLTWFVYPPNFDKDKKYPAILYCQGGPQSAVSQFWSYRWNFCLMASEGFVMIAPNRRGVPGFGTEWEEQISRDYPGQNMQDYLTAVDYAKENIPQIDPARIGCTGASYGGFSTYWLAGHHDKRFAAFFAHAGIFNTVAQYLETEEMWFANWDMGGPYWDKENAAAQRTYANSPHLFVDKWDTPIFVSHGEKDFRILASQGMAAFNAAKLRGVPAEMVIFPDENHWVLQPQNAVLWHRLFNRWFNKWLKVDANHNFRQLKTSDY